MVIGTWTSWKNMKYTDTTYSNATTSTAGLMSKEDKVKLNGIASGATANTGTITGVSVNNTSIATSGVANIPLSNGTGTAGAIKTTSTVTSNSGYTACPVISGVPYYKDTNTTYSNATQSKAGLMSPADKTKLDNISISSMPIGSGCDYYGQTAPEGFLFADGSAISRTEYSELFEIIGTLYGAGDGSTTFNLPDKRKRMSVMLESEDTAFNALGKTGGSVNHILTKAELPDYTLYSQAHAHSEVVTSVSASRTNTWDVNKTAASVTSVSSSKGNSASTTITVKSGGSGEAINIMNPYLVCNYIIKVK